MTVRGSTRPLKPKGLAKKVAELALSKKAEEVMLLDLTGLSAACDYFVIASGGSEQQVLAIADHIDEEMRGRGQPPWHVEGRSHRRWILLDFVDVVVHIFHQETRQYYLLEKLWGDAKVTRLEDDPKPRRSES